MASFDEVIPPGQAGKLRATIRTGDLRGPMDRGITITTDDPSQSAVYLGFHLDVIGSVVLLPRGAFDLRMRRVARELVSRVLVRRDPGETGTLAIRDVTASAPWLTVRSWRVEAASAGEEGAPSVEPGDWWIEVAALGEPPQGAKLERVTFSTGLPREPVVEIPVHIAVPPPLFTSVDRLVLPAPGAEGHSSGTLLISVRADLGSETLSIVADPPFRVALEGAGQRRYRAVVTWSPPPSGSEPAARQGTIVLRVGAVSRSVEVLVEGAPGP